MTVREGTLRRPDLPTTADFFSHSYGAFETPTLARVGRMTTPGVGQAFGGACLATQKNHGGTDAVSGGWPNIFNLVTIPARTVAPFLCKPQGAVMQWGVNDGTYLGDAVFAQAFPAALKACVAWMRLASVYATATPSAGTTLVVSADRGGSYYSATVIGEKATFSLPAAYDGGAIWVCVQAASGSTVQYRVKVDGVSQGVVSATGVSLTAGGAARIIPIATRYAAQAPGAHSVEVSFDSGVGTFAAAWVGVEPAAPAPMAPVVILGQPRIPAAATYSVTDTTMSLMNAAMASVAAQFDDRVRFAPLEAIINAGGAINASMFLSDGIHPGPLGVPLIVDAVVQAFRDMNLSTLDLSYIGIT